MNIINEHIHAIKRLFLKERVFFAYLFGSQVTGEIGGLSDIDIAVYFDERLSKSAMFDSKLRIMAEISKLLKRDDVDVVILNDAYPLFAHRIIKQGTVIFSNNEKTRIDFEVKIVMAYLDFKPYIEKHMKEAIYGRQRKNSEVYYRA